MILRLERMRVETYIEYHSVEMTTEEYKELRSKFDDDYDLHVFLLDNEKTEFNNEDHHDTERQIIHDEIELSNGEIHPLPYPIKKDKK